MSVPLVRFHRLWIQQWITEHDLRRVVALGYLGVHAWLAARPSFSQLPHVRHRFLAPKHPPHTLCSLTMFFHGRRFQVSPLARRIARSVRPGALKFTFRSFGLLFHPGNEPFRPLARTYTLADGVGFVTHRPSTYLSTCQRASRLRRALQLRRTRRSCKPPPNRRLASSLEELVEMTGIEPATSALQRRRSPS